MYIDYQTKQALIEYPEEEKFLRESNDKYRVVPDLSENKTTASMAEKRPLDNYQVISIEDDETDRSTKRAKNA